MRCLTRCQCYGNHRRLREYLMRAEHGISSRDMAPERIAAIFDMFGPYHVARLNALARSAETLGIEIAGRSKVYAWDRVSDETLFKRQTLFEVDDSAMLGRAQIDTALGRALGDFRPDAVLVPGWSTRAAIAAARWCFREGVPAVVMSESTPGDARRAVWKEWLKRRYIAMYDGGLVGGRVHMDYLESLGVPGGSIFLGYNAVDNAYFAAGASRARAAAADVRRALALPRVSSPSRISTASWKPSRNSAGCGPIARRILFCSGMDRKRAGSRKEWLHLESSVGYRCRASSSTTTCPPTTRLPAHSCI
jgi:hypothetical protein